MQTLSVREIKVRGHALRCGAGVAPNLDSTHLHAKHCEASSAGRTSRTRGILRPRPVDCRGASVAMDA